MLVALAGGVGAAKLLAGLVTVVDPAEITVVEGHPAPTLLDASRGADLLVVGSRGHGEFAGMLIGSVSQHLVSTAHCPVLVWRGDDKRA